MLVFSQAVFVTVWLGLCKHTGHVYEARSERIGAPNSFMPQ